MPVRDDIHGLWRCPKQTADFLRRLGGSNPFGEPLYRMVRAEDRYMKMAGHWTKWDPAIPVSERGGMQKVSIPLPKPEPVYANVGGETRLVKWAKTREVMLPSQAKPLSTESGIAEVARYPMFRGFILERWYPAAMWGSKTEWNAEENCLPDGTPMLGPYPQFGDYDAAVGPWAKLPGSTVLQKAVAYVEDKIQNQPDTAEGRRAKRINRAADEAEKKSQRYQKEMSEYIRDKSSFVHSSTLEGGRLRNEMGLKAGLKSHIGN